MTSSGSLPRTLGVCPQPDPTALTFSNQEFTSCSLCLIRVIFSNLHIRLKKTLKK